MKRFLIPGLVLVCCLTVAAQDTDTISPVPSIIPPQPVHVLRIVNTRRDSPRKIQLDKGRKVWVSVDTAHSKDAIRKARIVDVHEHAVIFEPTNNALSRVAYADSAIVYIAYTSAGRIVLASAVATVFVGTAIAGAVIITCGIVVQAVLLPFLLFSNRALLDYSFKWVGDAFKDIGLLLRSTFPFKRKFKFPNTKWKLLIENNTDYLATAREGQAGSKAH